jgi:hypothetical protein
MIVNCRTCNKPIRKATYGIGETKYPWIHVARGTQTHNVKVPDSGGGVLKCAVCKRLVKSHPEFWNPCPTEDRTRDRWAEGSWPPRSVMK